MVCESPIRGKQRDLFLLHFLCEAGSGFHRPLRVFVLACLPACCPPFTLSGISQHERETAPGWPLASIPTRQVQLPLLRPNVGRLRGVPCFFGLNFS